MYSWPGPDRKADMCGTMRSFWAFELPDRIIENLKAVQYGIKTLYPHLKWVKPENVHLTMHFLGNLYTPELEKQVEVLKPVINQQKPIPVSLGNLGVFPDWAGPRVLWIDLKGSLKPLNDLHKVTGGVLRKWVMPWKTGDLRPI